MLAEALLGGALGIATAVPLAWKWELGLHRIALPLAALALLATAIAVALDLVVDLEGVPAIVVAWLLTLFLAVALVLQRFYRDPERRPPDDDDVMVSPADGRIVYIRRAEGGVLPVSHKFLRDYPLEELTRTRLHTGDALVIGISLSLLDVHVNRAPTSGRIAFQRHSPGRFGSLKRPEMVFENERATIVIERAPLQVAVVLIASRLVRRIVTFREESDEIAVGERIGVIRFGSQVDVVIPADAGLAVTVAEGDRVVAGESIIARRAQ